MLTGTPETVTLIPIARVEILNSRERNMKIFEEIVENIKSIGLKKPITVTARSGDDGNPKYLLVCGEGRLNAFRILGETHIPALVVDVSDEDAFIMSLAENIARRGHRPLEILADIEILRKRGYDADTIIHKTGLSPKYVKDIVFLLDQGEERLIEGIQRGAIPLTTALEIARAKDDALLKATPPEQRTDFKPTERDKQLAPIEQIVKLEKEMSQVQTQYKDAEENYCSDLLNLVVAKGYLTKLLGNNAVKSYITRHEPEILEHFELVVNTVSMEEAVQQRLEADGEFEEDPDSNDQPAAENTSPDSENDTETQDQEGKSATE